MMERLVNEGLSLSLFTNSSSVETSTESFNFHAMDLMGCRKSVEISDVRFVVESSCWTRQEKGTHEPRKWSLNFRL